MRDDLVAAVQRAGEDYAAFIESQPPESLQRRPSAEEWTAAELSGHVAEFPTVLAQQARQLIANPGALLGRDPDDASRLAAVTRLGAAGPIEAAAAVREGVHKAAELLKDLPAHAWEIKGRHRRAGEITVAQLVENFIVGHIHEHLNQARTAVAS